MTVQQNLLDLTKELCEIGGCDNFEYKERFMSFNIDRNGSKGRMIVECIPMKSRIWPMYRIIEGEHAMKVTNEGAICSIVRSFGLSNPDTVFF